MLFTMFEKVYSELDVSELLELEDDYSFFSLVCIILGYVLKVTFFCLAISFLIDILIIYISLMAYLLFNRLF